MMIVTPETLSLEQRSELLAIAITEWARKDWRVVSQTQTQAQLIKGHRTNHILHLILTILTLGVWAVVWLLVAAFGGEQHMLVTIDQHGQSSAARSR